MSGYLTSYGASFVEVDDIDLDTFFERQVKIVRTRPHREKILRFAKYNRKPRVLQRFFKEFVFPLDESLGTSLLRHNLVELALYHIQRKNKPTRESTT